MLARRPSPVPLESPPPSAVAEVRGTRLNAHYPDRHHRKPHYVACDEEIRMPLTRRHGRCGPNRAQQRTRPAVALCPHAKGSLAGRSA